MPDETGLEILKRALLLERQGKLFYEQVASRTESPAVRELFSTLAAEEEKHARILAAKGGPRLPADRELPDSLSQAVLTGEVRRQISAASFEAAAISAAIELENRAVAVYSARAQAASDPGERELYAWLAQWERGHQRFLAKINEELLEEIWQDRGFWPF